jgi:hypothetical protein
MACRGKSVENAKKKGGKRDRKMKYNILKENVWGINENYVPGTKIVDNCQTIKKK